MLTFIFVTFAFFLVIYIKLRTDIYNDESSRKAHPTSLYPNIFFNEVFSSCTEEDVNVVEKLQKEITALQPNRTVEDPKSNVCSISKSTRLIAQEYEKCLQRYLADFQNSEKRNIAIERLKNKIELAHKAIEKEKKPFYLTMVKILFHLILIDKISLLTFF